MTEYLRKPHVVVVNNEHYYTAFDEDHTTKDILMYLIDSGSPRDELVQTLESLSKEYKL